MMFSKIAFLLFIISILWFSYSGVSNKSNLNNSHGVVNKELNSVNLIALEKDVEQSMLLLLSTLRNINDIPSAIKAIEIIKKVNVNLKMDEPKMYQVATLSRMHIKQYVTNFIPHLQKPLNRLRDIEGVAKVIDPALKDLEETLILYKKF